MNVEAGCRSKQAYLTKAHAKQIARSMTGRHREGFHLYDCPNCGYFHVGHVIPAFLRQPQGHGDSLGLGVDKAGYLPFLQNARNVALTDPAGTSSTQAAPMPLDCRAGAPTHGGWDISALTRASDDPPMTMTEHGWVRQGVAR